MIPLVTLGLFALYLFVAFGLRTWLHVSRTGTTGFVGFSGPPLSLERLGGVLFACALVLGAAAPALGALGLLEPLFPVTPPLVAVGLSLYACGVAGTFWSQVAMGSSWRIGVDAAETTALVTRGPFRLVRNPIFSFMLVAGAGLSLLVPNAVALAGFVALLVAIELQVRVVEEPYLLRTHGAAYRTYAAAAGRFLPGLGRLRPPDRKAP